MAKTLDEIREILTVHNIKHQIDGPLAPGTEVTCLRRNNFGHYLPCVAYIVVNADKWITVNLWSDQSERVTVSRKAILWPPEGA